LSYGGNRSFTRYATFDGSSYVWSAWDVNVKGSDIANYSTTAQANALYLPINNPTFTGTLNGPTISGIDYLRVVKAGSNTVGTGPYFGAFWDTSTYKGGFFQLDASSGLSLYIGNSGATAWVNAVKFYTDLSVNFAGSISEGGTALSTKYQAKFTGNTSQYVRGDGSLATFPTLGSLAAKSTVTWTSDIINIPTGLAQASQPIGFGNIRFGTTAINGWHGIEFSDYKNTKLLVNSTGATDANTAGIYDGSATDAGWLFAFDRTSTLAKGYVPATRVSGTLSDSQIASASVWNAKLSANQTITISGVVSGSGTTAITTTMANGALTIAKTSGLQAALDGKQAAGSYVIKTGDSGLGDLSGSGFRATKAVGLDGVAYSNAGLYTERGVNNSSYHAGIGFHNNGVNAAYLYYDNSTSGDATFRYRTHNNGDHAIWCDLNFSGTDISNWQNCLTRTTSLETRMNGVDNNWINYSLVGHPHTLSNITDRQSVYTIPSNDIGTAQYLRWKKYGTSHEIVDLSNGTAPDDSAHDRYNAEIAWTASFPILMGWDGGNTYGVRSDTVAK
jgi:hypothetical protein